MMNNCKTIICLFWACFLLACAAQGPAYEPIDGSELPHATIVIYRPPKLQGVGITPSLFVNDEDKFKLKNGGFGVVEVPPGSHTISTPRDDRFTTDDAPGSFDISVEAGEVYFVRWQPVVSSSGVILASPAPVGYANFIGEFIPVNRNLAELELAEIKRVYP